MLHIVDAAGTEGRDPVEDVRKINEELAAYNEELAGRKQIIAANKTDCIPDGEDPVARLKEAYEPLGYEVMPMSAVTGEGVREVLLRVKEVLDETELAPIFFEQEYFPEDSLIHEELPFTVERLPEDPHIFVTEGPKIDKMLGYTNLDSEKGFAFFQRFLKEAGILEALEQAGIQEGDTVNLDYAGTVDGVPFTGGTASGQTLTIGSHQFIPGFEEQMIGMSLGEEKDLNVRFPDEYHAEELKGKDAVFHVKVNGIQMTEKPELDDDFAADISEFDTFEAYKENIVSELTKQIEKDNDITIENALIEKAAENAQMDIPAAMIEDQAEYLVREMGMRMSYQGLRMEDYLKYTGQTMDDLKQMYKPEAEKRVRTELTIEAIRKAENIEPSEEDIEKEIAEQAERLGRDVETFRKDLSDEQKEYLKDSAAIRKVLDLLKQDAKVEEKKTEEPEEKTAEKKPAKKAAAKKSDPEATEKKSAAKKASAKKTETDGEKPAKKPVASKNEDKDAE